MLEMLLNMVTICARQQLFFIENASLIPYLYLHQSQVTLRGPSFSFDKYLNLGQFRVTLTVFRVTLSTRHLFYPTQLKVFRLTFRTT